ncbi:unnamed protein product [Ixodes hexagonus]
MTTPDVARPYVDTRDPLEITRLLTSYSSKLCAQICGLSTLRSEDSLKTPHHHRFAQSGTDWEELRHSVLGSQDDILNHFLDFSDFTAPSRKVSTELICPEDIAVQADATGSKGEESEPDVSEHFLLRGVSHKSLRKFWAALLWSSSPESSSHEDDDNVPLTNHRFTQLSRNDIPERVLEDVNRPFLHHTKNLRAAQFRFQTSQRAEERHKEQSGEADRVSDEAMQRERTAVEAFHASLDNLSRIVEEMSRLARIEVPGCSKDEDREESRKKTSTGSANEAPPQKVEEGRQKQTGPFDFAEISNGRGSSQENSLLYFPALVMEKLGYTKRRCSLTPDVSSRPETRLQEGRTEPREGPLTGLEEIGSSRRHLPRRHSSHGLDGGQGSGSHRCASKAELEPSLLRLDEQDRDRCHKPADKLGAPPKKTVSNDNESSRNKRQSDWRSHGWESAPAEMVADEEWPADFGHPFVEGGRACKESVHGRMPASGLEFDREMREALSSQHMWCFADSDGAAPRDASAQRRAEVDKTSIGGNPDEPFPQKPSSVRLVSDPVREGQRLCNVSIVCYISPAPPDSPVTLPSHLRRAHQSAMDL